jgi:hypothetical protein
LIDVRERKEREGGNEKILQSSSHEKDEEEEEGEINLIPGPYAGF